MGFIFSARGQPERRSWGISYPTDLIPRRSTSSGHPYITADSAMNSSAVWAALRLRADLMSTLPIDGFRKVTLEGEQIQIEAGLTAFMNAPGFMEWRYSSQIELDRSGNSIGIILEKNSQGGFPTAIELQPSSHCSLVYKKGKLDKYRIAGDLYNPDDIWHERQFTVSGLDMGLSPVAHAAYVLGQYVSIQQFATDWFIGGATPRARLATQPRS